MPHIRLYTYNMTMKSRYNEFNLLKVLAIFGLPAVHITEIINSNEELLSEAHITFNIVIISLCMFGASLFMICMGFGISNAYNGNYMLRGIQFLLLGLILNVLRYVVPDLFKYLLTDMSFNTFCSNLAKCFKSDIYYFVGLFFILYAVLRHFKLSDYVILGISIIILIDNIALYRFIDIDNTLISCICGNFFYVDNMSCFPLATWFVFPCIGIVLGDFLKKLDTEKYAKAMKYMLICSSFVFINFIGIFMINDWTFYDILTELVGAFNYYYIDTLSVILLTCITFFTIPIAYYICKKRIKGRVIRYLLKMSVYLVPFYMLQWIVIDWTFAVFDILNVTVTNTVIHIILMVGITFICAVISSKYGKKLMRLLMKITWLKPKQKVEKVIS